jgi:transposase
LSPGCAPSSLISQKTKLAEAIRYALSRWEGLLASSTTAASRSIQRRRARIRPIALNRKNALFAGSDGGGEHWAVIASLIETCKLNGVDPQTYLADVITRQRSSTVTPTAKSTISCPGLIPPRVAADGAGR